MDYVVLGVIFCLGNLNLMLNIRKQRIIEQIYVQIRANLFKKNGIMFEGTMQLFTVSVAMKRIMGASNHEAVTFDSVPFYD